MKRYPLSELVKKWEREDVTVEQAVGQLLLWLVSMVERVDKLEHSQQKNQQSEVS